MDKEIVLTGSLGFLSLGDLLQLVGSGGGTGTLRILSKYAPEPGQVRFHKGNIVSAENALLEPAKKIGLDAMYSLFGWLEGEFEFVREDLAVKKTITINRMEIILDGLRMVDEGVVPILGPVSFQKKASDGDKGPSIPVIKGPLVDYMYVVDEEEFGQSRKISAEGSHGSWVWVILEGVVDIVKETSRGPLTLLKIADGAFIGSMTSFLFQGSLRTFTAMAATNVQLGVLDSQRLSNEYSKRSREFRELAVSIDKRLKEVNERAVEVYLKENRFKTFVKEKKPFKLRGEDSLLRIVRGEACVARKTKAGHIPFANMGPDDFIGNIPFLDMGHEPGGASVFVSEDFEAEEVDTGEMGREYGQLSPTLRNMIENTATRISILTSSAVSFQKQLVRKKNDADTPGTERKQK